MNRILFCKPRRNRPILKEEFANDFTKTVFRLAKKRIGGTIIINHRINPDSEHMLQNMSTNATLLNKSYTSQALTAIFEKNSPLHDGAVVINLFEEPTIYSARNKLDMDSANYWNEVASESAIKANLISLGTRHWSAYSFSHYTRALIIVISEEQARVSLFKNGNVELGVTKEKFIEEISNAYVKEINKQGSNSSDSYSFGSPCDSQHFKTYFSIQMFDRNDSSDAKWFKENFFKCRMQFFLGRTMSEGIILPGTEAYSIIRRGVIEQANISLLDLRYETDTFIVLKYGHNKLGGIYCSLLHNTRTVDLDRLNIFVDREHFNNNVIANFLKEMCHKLFKGYNRIIFHFDQGLCDSITKFVNDLNVVVVNTSDKIYNNYKLIISDVNAAASPQPFSSQSTDVSRLKKKQRILLKPKVPLIQCHSKQGDTSVGETFLIRLNIKVAEFEINRPSKQITWIDPDSDIAKHLKVGDVVEAINGVELSDEIEQFVKQVRTIGRVADLQIKRPTDCSELYREYKFE